LEIDGADGLTQRRGRAGEENEEREAGTGARKRGQDLNLRAEVGVLRGAFIMPRIADFGNPNLPR
jgi:hypothetical protein